MPTKRMTKEEIITSLDRAATSVDEASHYLRNRGNVYDSRQAARLEISFTRVVEVIASLRIPEETNG